MNTLPVVGAALVMSYLTYQMYDRGFTFLGFVGIVVVAWILLQLWVALHDDKDLLG